MRILLLLFVFFWNPSFASDTAKRYDPTANVEKDVAAALVKAKAQQKHVLLQIGGDWCVWCRRFDALIESDSVLQKTMKDNFVVYHLNYSAENKNLSYLKKLHFPQRFGFPVIVILDAGGKQLHTQDVSLLEQGNTYSRSQVKAFLQHWSPAALDEKNYKD